MSSYGTISDHLISISGKAEFLEKLCAQAWDAVFVHDLQGRILFANETACRSLGYTGRELLGVNASDIEVNARAADELREYWASMRPGEVRTFNGRHRHKDGQTFPVEVRVGLIEVGNDHLVFAIARDVSKRHQAESLLRTAVEGIASRTGEGFFQTLVQTLAECLKCRYAFVGEILPPGDRVQTLAAWMNGGPVENFSYNLAGSPCSQVARFGICHIPSGAQQAYPEDTALVSLEVESYYGMCLYNSDNEPIGLLTVLDDKPMQNPGSADSMLRIFATRAAAEIERLRMESALFKEQAFSQNLLESLPGLVYLCDEEGRLIRWNRNMEISTDYTAEDLRGSTIEKWFQGEDLRRIREAFQKVHTEGYAELEIDIHDREGRARPHFCTGTRIQWDGRPYLIGVALEVTRQKETEEALRDSREKYKTIFMNIQDIYYECTLDGVILEVSPSVEGVSDYAREELIGGHVLDLYYEPSEREHFLEILHRKGRVSDYELLVRGKHGNAVPCSVTATLVRDETGQPNRIFGILRDISERKRAEQERMNLENQLHQAQKMEAVGLLAGGVAHDFNNLLQVILGYTEFALNFIESDHPSYEMIDEVRKAGGRAETLIRQLLTFSRRDRLQREYLDLNTVVSGFSKMIRRVIGENIALHFHETANLPLIHADPGQIEQILMNLCVNARDAMSEGGELTISVDLFQPDEEFVRTRAGIRSRPYARLTIADTGEGMTEEVRARAFEPFFTTKKAGAGTGLGLATVYAIVERHQGFIDLESARGHGTTFHIGFPIAAAEVPEKETGPEPRETGSVGGTILLAEDEEQVRELTRRVLTKAGYRVVTASDGLEALSLFRELGSQVNMAILDVVMPRMSGQAVCDAIRDKHPDLPILFVSGYSFDFLESKYTTSNMPPLLAKPYSPQELLGKVAELLDENRRDRMTGSGTG